MEEAVRQEFNRAYQIMNERDEKRSKEIAENNTQIALLIASQKRCSDDLKLAIENMHGWPCRDHLDLKATVSEHLKKHADEIKTTVELAREKRGAWRTIKNSLLITACVTAASFIWKGVIWIWEAIGKS